MDGKDGVLQPIRWTGRSVVLLDQTALPHTYRHLECTSVEDVASAIREMRVRGAPAIGVTAAYGYLLATVNVETGGLPATLAHAYETLVATRPTAVNLRWALDRMRAAYEAHMDMPIDSIRERLRTEARRIHDETDRADREIGRLGAELLRGRHKLLTHCNAGPLATGGYGTAIGVIRSAYEQDGDISVLVDETRPFLQGARLTAWELQTLGIPATLITDNMAGFMMQRGEVEAVIVGADRIAANGDVANKIGTYSLAVLADAHGIPFYVAAPISTVDLNTPTGRDIPIEERDPREVTDFAGARVAPAGMTARHPAFDTTPARLVTAIITERGVARAPYEVGLAAVVKGAQPVG